MTPSLQVVAIYKTLLLASKAMLEHARKHEWDELVSLELQRRATIDSLREFLTGEDKPTQLSQEVAELIREILNLDEQTTALAELGMKNIEEVLGSAQTQKKLQNLYFSL